WRSLLAKFADRLPGRKVMIERTLAGKLPTLWHMAPAEKPSAWASVKSSLTFSDKPRKEPSLEPAPELIDTLWGYYYATGAARPITRIIALLPWSKDDDSVEKLTLGGMAKFTLAANAARDADLLAMLKRAREHQPKEVVPILDEVIEAAETV